MPARFSAWTYCPRCDAYDVHWLRLPIDPEPAEPTFVTRSYEIERWGQADAVRVDVLDPARTPESSYEVIRTCRKCYAEWGEGFAQSAITL